MENGLEEGRYNDLRSANLQVMDEHGSQGVEAIKEHSVVV